MEDWSTEFWKAWEAIATDAEQRVLEISQELADKTDAFFTGVEEFAEQVQHQLFPDLDQQLDDFFETIADALTLFEHSVEETAQPFAQTVEPILNEHAACAGCCNYHGHSYNGVAFVCAMHPYGAEEEKCPDWESAWGGE